MTDPCRRLTMTLPFHAQTLQRHPFQHDYYNNNETPFLKLKQVVKVIDKKAASLPHVHGSIVFARLRQCAPASRSVQPFLHGSRQSVPILYNGPFAPYCPLHGGSGPPSNTCFLEPTRVHNPTGILIGATVFAQFTADSPYTIQLQWAALPP